MAPDYDQMAAASVCDQPWGQVLAALAAERATGELVVTGDDGKRYAIVFAHGAIAAATSPLVADSVARIALLAQLVSSTQVQAIAKALGDTSRDEVDALAELAHLSRAQIVGLRSRVTIQRAARTFAVEAGVFAFEERAVAPGTEIDVAAAIYLGAHMYMPQQRLTLDLRELGSRFVLHHDVAPDRYGFGDDEQAIVEALRGGTSLPELEAHHRDIDPRTAEAVIYALVTTGACEGTGGVARRPGTEDEFPRSRTVTFETPTRVRFARPTDPAGNSPLSRTVTPRSAVATARETIEAAKRRMAHNAGHYTVLGLQPDASLDAIRSAYVAFTCQLHPDKQPELSPEEERDANEAFTRMTQAYAVLSDPVRRADYDAKLHGKGPPSPERKKVATEAYERGMAALRRDDMDDAVVQLQRAVALAPGDLEYHAMLAWARFCNADSRAAVANETRRALERAIYRSGQPARARFHLGLVERMLGRSREALHHFREVLALDPDHAEAAAEIRILEQRAERPGRR